MHCTNRIHWHIYWHITLDSDLLFCFFIIPWLYFYLQGGRKTWHLIPTHCMYIKTEKRRLNMNIPPYCKWWWSYSSRGYVRSNWVNCQQEMTLVLLVNLKHATCTPGDQHVNWVTLDYLVQPNLIALGKELFTWHWFWSRYKQMSI